MEIRPATRYTLWRDTASINEDLIFDLILFDLLSSDHSRQTFKRFIQSNKKQTAQMTPKVNDAQFKNARQ